MAIKHIRNGLHEWDSLPDGYDVLPVSEPVQGGDVQRIHDTWYCEYPKNGFLVGCLRGAGGIWYRRKSPLTEKEGERGMRL